MFIHFAHRFHTVGYPVIEVKSSFSLASMELEVSLTQSNAAITRKEIEKKAFSPNPGLPEFMAPSNGLNTGEEMDVFQLAILVVVVDESGNETRFQCLFDVSTAYIFFIPSIVGHVIRHRRTPLSTFEFALMRHLNEYSSTQSCKRSL